MKKALVLSLLMVCLSGSSGFAGGNPLVFAGGGDFALTGFSSFFIGSFSKFFASASGNVAGCPWSNVTSFTAVGASPLLYLTGTCTATPAMMYQTSNASSVATSNKMTITAPVGYSISYITVYLIQKNTTTYATIYPSADGSFLLNTVAAQNQTAYTYTPYIVPLPVSYIYGSTPVSMYGSVPFEPFKVSATAPDEMNYFNSLVFFAASFCFVPAVCTKLMSRG
jgi:hypothetical protein